MRWLLGGLVLLILALTSGAVAVLTLGRCPSNTGVDGLGCVLSRGFGLATLGGCASLIALTLGTLACVITRKSQQWGWFAIFLSATVSLGAAIALILVISNTPLWESMRDSVFSLLWAVLVLPSALALLTLSYLMTTAIRERRQTVSAAR